MFCAHFAKSNGIDRKGDDLLSASLPMDYCEYEERQNNNQVPNGGTWAMRPVKRSHSLWEQLWINCRAGACGGIAVTLTTLGIANGLSFNRPLGVRLLALHTVPGVAIYFSVYEHLKQHFKNTTLYKITDKENKPWHRTFMERFTAAGVAGSLVSWSAPSASLLLGLRYAAFFGSFELFKDMKSQSIDHKRQLCFNEVALTAGAGGVVASVLYYPALQLSLHSSPSLLSTAGHTVTFSTQIRQILSQNVNCEFLFRGFGNHLTKFLPSCVACSCAFEFSRRYFDNQSSNE
ncbi:hypothetical protein RFI_03592 [Reticulomyxa filosa]|uniref:Mitochondrial carrier protein n=1 Tax=Reticulomyxa filosa TaxID=46433 RepID=X6P5Z4_RETFI|nr:hypothetical protein RFI_03592 [Reticulomyxa filosa]|eukprot:ETO33509.1 hypothetical protein RFI_03592 [Reticulomyxa filosa]